MGGQNNLFIIDEAIVRNVLNLEQWLLSAEP